jgi:enoyl-CoA hydratase/carnithine racemase
MNHKLLNPQAIRKIALEGHRWTPAEPLEAGVADKLVEEGKGYVLKAAHAMTEKQAPLAKTGLSV